MGIFPGKCYHLKRKGMLPGFCLGGLIAQGVEGYSRVPRFDQNTVRDSEKVNGIRDLTATWGAGFEKIWAWISDELEKKTIVGIADDQRSGNSVDSREKKTSWNAGSDSPFHTLIGDLILLFMFWTREDPPPPPQLILLWQVSRELCRRAIPLTWSNYG